MWVLILASNYKFLTRCKLTVFYKNITLILGVNYEYEYVYKKRVAIYAEKMDENIEKDAVSVSNS